MATRPPRANSNDAMEATDPMLGQVIAGKYRVEKLIGVGGMGAVYRATQLVVSRPVAIKVLRQVPGVSEHQLTERFKREAMATSTLKHPNTVQVIDFGEDQGLLFMVLELLEGAPLVRVIQREAPLAPERVAAIGKQIAKSLAEAHEQGIVHRDLKPDNVFICNYHGDPDFTKVMDFGIARIVTADVAMTRTGMMIGTPKYMAPEQAMAKKVGPPADLYALGVILFEMLTGVPPFNADSGMALALAHINEPPPPLLLPGYPEPLAEAWRGLVGSLLMKNPDKRAQSASQVAGWLQQVEVDAQRWAEVGRSPLLSTLPGREPTATYDGPSPRTTMTIEQAMRPRDANRVWVWTAAIAFMILGGLVAFLLVRPTKKVSNIPAVTAPLTPDAHSDSGADH